MVKLLEYKQVGVTMVWAIVTVQGSSVLNL
jgi:hypothetical protein